jgi:hypothetical protein
MKADESTDILVDGVADSRGITIAGDASELRDPI